MMPINLDRQDRPSAILEGRFGRSGGGGRVPRHGGDDGSGSDDSRPTPELAYRIAVALMVISLGIMFVTTSVVYVFRLPQKSHAAFHLPDIVWANTGVLLFSSLTLFWALRQVRRNNLAGLTRGLALTLVLGAVFVIGQLSAWSELSRMGLRPDSDFFNGYFYLITGMHGLHLVSGLIVLAVMFIKAHLRRYTRESHLGLDLGAFYWHFLDVLWVALFALLLL